MRKSKFTKVLAVLLCLTMVLGAFAGCAPKGDDGDTVVLTALFEQNEGWVKNFSPFSPSFYQCLQGFAFEPLVIFDSYNNGEETMWLAEDIVSEPDNKTLTIKLRDGVKWSDGEKFDADDVVFTFEYSKKFEELDTKGFWKEDGPSEIASVTKVDDLTVKIEMVQANRFHRNTVFLQTWMVPEHVWSKIDNPRQYIYETDKVVATGAFTELKSFAPEMLHFAKNPHYWNAENLAVDEIKVPQFNSNDAALGLLATGNIDWAHIMIPNIEETYVSKAEGNDYWYGMNDGVRISMNYASEDPVLLEVFNNVAFKQAASMAVDRTYIIDAAAYGYLVDTVPTNTGLPGAVRGYVNDEAEKVMAKYTKFDVEGAKAILAEAGFVDKDGDGFVETPKGDSFELTIVSPAGWSDWNDGAQIAAEGMQAAGINVTSVPTDLGMVTEKWASGDWTMLYGGYGLASDPYSFYWNSIANEATALTNSWWSVCQTNYINEEINAVIAKLPTAKTDADVKAITDEVELYFAENMINIPVLYNGNWVLYNNSRFSGWATEANPFCNPAICQHDSKLLQLMALKPVPAEAK